MMHFLIAVLKYNIVVQILIQTLMKQSRKWNQLKLKEPEIGMINTCPRPEDGETQGEIRHNRDPEQFFVKLKVCRRPSR